MRDKIYLGDGAYVEKGVYFGELVLTTSDGMHVTNRIVLGPTEWELLNSFMSTWDDEADR